MKNTLRMTRKILALVLASLALLPASGALAHPLDISATTATVKPTGVDMVTYLHSYEAELLMTRAWLSVRGANAYVRRADVITSYVLASVRISTGGRDCPVGSAVVPEQPMYEILSKWLEVRYSATCAMEASDEVVFRLDFFPDLPLQTNRLAIYDARSVNPLLTPRASYVLTPRIPERAYAAWAAPAPRPDADRDGLPDDEERIYRTDPTNPDTDGDNYSDYEEATLGWNPIDPIPGPGQRPRDEYEKFDISTVLFASGAELTPGANKEYAERYVRTTNLLDSSGWGQEYLVGTLRALDGMANNFSWTSAGWALLGVMLLGFLHALGPGHAKWLLAALVADRRRGYAESIVFAAIFTVTHLIDIVLLFAITRGVFAIADPTTYMVYLQMGATALLAGVGLWLLVTSVRRLGRPVEEHAPVSKRVWFLTGLIAGIAPCTFGWSLFLLLFSLGRLDLVPLILSAFGLGIFACLAMVATVLYLARESAFRGVDFFARWSPVVSGAFIFGIALYLGAGYFG